jgi:hypothetical protein
MPGHPLRAELEIQELGEQQLIQLFFSQGLAILSVPLLGFIDGFGLYRNMMRSIMGFYLLIASFNSNKRNRRANVLSLTLGPHESNFPDVVKCLVDIKSLDAGLTLTINGVPVRVCVFVIDFIGDMVQQMSNCGLMALTFTRGCRFCILETDKFDDLDVDVHKLGHYHHELLRQRVHLESVTTMAQKKAFNDDKKLQIDGPPVLRMITPALDLVLSRPTDPSHSEYGGITKQFHLLFIDAILTPRAALQYAQKLRSFPKPAGWGPFQSPTH